MKRLIGFMAQNDAKEDIPVAPSTVRTSTPVRSLIKVRFCSNHLELGRWFESVEMMRFFTDGQRKITECHYPMMSWPFSNHEGWMVYGHIHENTRMDYWPLIARNDHMLNAGVDINGFAPVRASATIWLKPSRFLVLVAEMPSSV